MHHDINKCIKTFNRNPILFIKHVTHWVGRKVQIKPRFNFVFPSRPFNVEILHWLFLYFFVQKYSYCEKEWYEKHCIFKDKRLTGHLKTRLFYDRPYMLHATLWSQPKHCNLKGKGSQQAHFKIFHKCITPIFLYNI